MNKQQEMQRYFDRAVSGVLKQGCKSVSHNGSCRYRGSYGAKCAIGHLLPDKLYCPDLEGRGILKLSFTNLIPVRWKRYIPFFRDLQRAHDRVYYNDSAAFIQEFKKNALDVAKKYNLEYKF